MENKLTEDQLREIDREAEILYPMPPASATNVTNFTTGFIKAKREAYAAAASKYLLQNMEDRKAEAIMFATWVENNQYVRFDKYYWTNDECETRLSDEQLYHKFKLLTNKPQ